MYQLENLIAVKNEEKKIIDFDVLEVVENLLMRAC